MTTIAGFAEGILDGTIPPERERESLQIVVSRCSDWALVRGGFLTFPGAINVQVKLGAAD